MTRFSATALDLSRFPAPLAIRGIDYEKILSERKARLAELFAARGIAYDVASLETDPVIAVEETDGYRELLAYAAVNDSVRAVLIGFATGADLDHLAAFYGVARRVLTPASGSTPAVLEGDAEFRRRVLLAPEAFATAGTHGGYVFHALTAHPDVLNADVWTPAPGEVVVAIQSRYGDGAASDELVGAVLAHLSRRDIKPLTDVVTVRSVVNFPFAIDVQAFVQPGPDPAMVWQAVIESLAAMAAARRTPSRDVPRSAIFAAATVGPVDRVAIAAPAGDIAMGYGEVAVCTGIDVTVSEHDG